MFDANTSPNSEPGEIIFPVESNMPTIPAGDRMRVTDPRWMNLLPYIERERLSWEKYRASAIERGLPEPSLMQWTETFELSESELLARKAMVQQEVHASLEELSDFVFIKHYGDKPRVCRRRDDGQMDRMSWADFQTAYAERKTTVYTKEGEQKVIPLTQLWRSQARQYDRAEFLPGMMPWQVPDGVYNIRPGWPEGLQRVRDKQIHVLGDPIPDDDEHDGPDEPAEASLFLDHLYYNVCDEDESVYWYILGWMADALLRPGLSETAVALTGPSGSGKGTFAELFGSFFGSHFLTVNNRDQLTGKFNQHLQEAQLVFADEVDFKNNDQASKTLRNLITDPHMIIEPKGVNAFQAKKWFRIILASNEDHIVNALSDDRRFLVLNVDAKDRNQDRAYFRAIRQQWEQGGKVAMFRYLTGRWWQQRLETGEWDVGDRPITSYLQQQKEESMPPAERVIRDMLWSGDPGCFCLADRTGDIVFVPTVALLDGNRLNRTQYTKRVGMLLSKVAGEGATSTRETVNGDRPRGYWLPPLAQARRNWERHLGREVPWPDDVQSWGFEGRASTHSPDDDLPF